MQILLAFALSLLRPLTDTFYVKINLSIKGQETNVVTLEAPLNNELFVASNPKPFKRDNNLYSVNYPYSSYSFFSININGERVIPIALNSNDSISIETVRIVNSGIVDYQIKFSGTNALAHDVYTKRFFPAGKNLGFFETLSKTAPTQNDYYVKAKQYIDSLTSVWDSLKAHNQISNEAYDLYMADTKATLYDEAISKFYKVDQKDRSYESFINWLNLKQVMFYHADAANRILLRTYTGFYCHRLYLKSILDSDVAIQDSILRKSDLRAFYYYDNSYRELAWGNYLYYLKRQFPSESLGNNPDAKAFQNYYPNSQYLKQINIFDDSIIKERKALKEPVFIDSTNYKNLNEILASLKERYIFIDIWATWCSPCIQEFNYVSQLTSYLYKNEIGKAYLSIDKSSDAPKWSSFVRKSYIPGHHFLISEKIQDQLLKILSEKKGESALFIPRYLLFDKQTNKYYIDLPRPSSGIILQSTIDKIINDSR